MGDAGPPTPVAVLDQSNADPAESLSSLHKIREVNVLVTGYGPFKAFTTNPSYLITRNLPAVIEPASQQELLKKHSASSPRQSTGKKNGQPYRIIVHAYPTPLRVAYASTSTFIPRLIRCDNRSVRAEHPAANTNVVGGSGNDHSQSHAEYDYVLHIGMAGGRDNYALETIAHRDHYKIKDVDDRDGFISGEYVWKRDGLPEQFEVGWDTADVLARWEKLTDKAENEYEEAMMENMGFSQDKLGSSCTEDVRDRYRSISMIGKGRRAVVKLSRDAGRFLCEFILYTSLSTRWKEVRDMEKNGSDDGESNAAASSSPTFSLSQNTPGRVVESPRERLGKIAFLHVPGATMEHDIARGTRVTEAAILALVSSWEDGYRNKEVYNEA